MAELCGLHVDVFGEGIPAIMVHGSYGWGLDQFLEVPALADEYRVVVFDRRGFGASPAGDVIGWSTDVGDIGHLLDRFGPAHLVGVSSGGVVALLAASWWPDRIRSLVAIEPPLFNLIPANRVASTRAAEMQSIFTMAAAGGLTLEKFIHEIVRNAEGSEEDAQQWLAGMSDGDRAAAAATMREQWWPDAPIDFAVLAATTFPKVVVSGAYPDGGDPARVNDDICAALAELIRARRFTFARSGHNPQIDQPHEFNRFLRGVWASAG